MESFKLIEMISFPKWCKFFCPILPTLSKILIFIIIVLPTIIVTVFVAHWWYSNFMNKEKTLIRKFFVTILSSLVISSICALYYYHHRSLLDVDWRKISQFEWRPKNFFSKNIERRGSGEHHSPTICGYARECHWSRARRTLAEHTGKNWSQPRIARHH